MGSNASKLAKKWSAPFRSNSNEDIKENANSSAVKSNSCPLVFSRRGSMYKDEDGDLAHEFYVEVPSKQHGSKATMKRVYDNLTPQGDVKYDNARLHGVSNEGNQTPLFHRAVRPVMLLLKPEQIQPILSIYTQLRMDWMEFQLKTFDQQNT